HLNPQDRPPSSPTAIATPGTVFAVMQPAQRAIAQRFCALAHNCVRSTAPFRTRLDNNGQPAARGPNWSAAVDAVDGAHSAASKCHRVVASKGNMSLRRGRTGTSRVMMV